jgi:hypothetical protein
MNSQPIPFIPRLSLTTAGATVYRRAVPGESLVAGRPLRRWFKLWHHRVRDIVFVRAVQLTPSITSYAMLRVLEGGDARFLQALVRHGEGMPTDMQLAMETASTLALLADREVEAFPPLRAPALRMLSQVSIADLYASDEAAGEGDEESEDQVGPSRGGALHEEASWAVAQLDEDDLLAGVQLADLARRELLMLVTRAPKLNRLS